MEILDGKLLSNNIKEEIKNEILNYEDKPTLAVISIGNDESSKVYIANKKKACEYVGINFIHIIFDEKSKEVEIINKIHELNNNRKIDGILIQLPIPSNFNETKLINEINPDKDVDGITQVSVGKQYLTDCLFIPCTVKGIMKIFDYYNIDLEGKNVVIVGRSNIVGYPSLIECLKRNATVTICHSRTKNLKEFTKKADILIVAVGKKHLITKDMIKKDSIIIDVGITRENNKIYGDVSEDVDKVCSMKTPVPGGVGPLTVAMLLENTLIAYKNRK